MQIKHLATLNSLKKILVPMGLQLTQEILQNKSEVILSVHEESLILL